MRIILKEPNMVQKKWTWEVTGANESKLSGKASTETEAWRLIHDAERLIERKESNK